MRRCFFFLALILVIGSCSRVLVDPNPSASPQRCFDQVWNDLRDQYVFFDQKRIDWDSIHAVYAPLIREDMSDRELFDVLSEMLLTLRDGHVTLYSPIDTARYFFYGNRPEYYNSAFVNTTYLLPNGVQTKGPLSYAILSGNVGYISYASFRNDIEQDDMDAVLNTLSGTRGLIIDIRNNTGGSNDNIYRLVEHFIGTSSVVGVQQEKLSPATNDLSAPYEIVVDPAGVYYQQPVVILTNSRVYSSANIFAAFMTTLPSVQLIGDTTGGGCGVPVSNQLPNGWLYRYSASIISRPDGTSTEAGIAPNIFITTGSAEEALGQDALIERALLELQ
jgi:Peptidase family S41/Tricorn protease C1 domain